LLEYSKGKIMPRSSAANGTGWIAMLLAVFIAPGCHQSSGSQQTVLPVIEASRQFARDEKVTVIQEVGEFALVRSSDGQQSYVALGLLKHRNTGLHTPPVPYTHTLIREAPAYARLPSIPPVTLAPRGLSEIDLEQRTLNGLFLSEKTGKRVIAPRNVPQFLTDEETGERCWHAYECNHPSCPGEKQQGEQHFIFVHTETDSQRAIHCPACEKIRNLQTETEAQWQKWGQFVQPYELPETLRRRAELSAERRQAIEAMRSGAMPPAQ